MTKEMLLTKGMVAIVDDEDFEWISKWKWTYHHNGYAIRFSIKDKPRHTSMHRQIMNPPSNMEIDHINHDGLDNRKCNLRICTKSQNQANGQIRVDNKSGYKGISWCSNVQKWKAQIRFQGEKITIGHFDNIRDAKRAYDRKAKELFGEFANSG